MNASLVLLADDHPLFRAALRETLAKLLPGVRVVESSGVAELQVAVHANSDADLLLLDLRMPGSNGFSTLIELRAMYPALPIAIVSAEEDPGVIRRALDFGASGFIPKSSSSEAIAEGLRAILHGDTWVPPDMLIGTSAADVDADLASRVASLTPQQFRVLTLLADGRLNKQIGGDLEVAEATIKAHVTAILRKLGLSRRTQAAVLAQRLLSADSGRLAPPEVAAEDAELD